MTPDSYKCMSTTKLWRHLAKTLSSQKPGDESRSKAEAVRLFFECSRSSPKLNHNTYNKMAATSVPLGPPSEAHFSDPERPAQMEEFSFAAPATPNSDLYAGSIETGEEYMETEKGQHAGSPFYSQFFSKKGYEWLLEVDESGDDEEFRKPLLYVYFTMSILNGFA